MKTVNKIAVIAAMIFVTCLSMSDQAHAQARCSSGGSFGLNLPNLNLYVGPSGVSVGSRRFTINTRSFGPYGPYGPYSPYNANRYRGYPRYTPPVCPDTVSPYRGRRPVQYIPPVTTYPRYNRFDYERALRDQIEIQRARERYLRELERIQRRRDCR